MARTSSVKSIRALERGLDVLQALQTGPGAGLKDLHEITGLSKATLLRILRTLMERNLVWRRMADGAYLPSSRPPPRRTASTEGQFTASHSRAITGEAISTRRLESSGPGRRAGGRLEGR